MNNNKLYIKNGGSDYSSQPYIRSEFIFNAKYKVQNVAQCMYEENHYSNFDDNIEIAETIPLKDHKSIGFSYMKYKKNFSFDARDFMLKGFKFYHNGKFYRYATSVPHKIGLEMKPSPNATVRGFILQACGTLQRDEKD